MRWNHNDALEFLNMLLKQHQTAQRKPKNRRWFWIPHKPKYHTWNLIEAIIHPTPVHAIQLKLYQVLMDAVSTQNAVTKKSKSDSLHDVKPSTDVLKQFFDNFCKILSEKLEFLLLFFVRTPRKKLGTAMLVMRLKIAKEMTECDDRWRVNFFCEVV